MPGSVQFENLGQLDAILNSVALPAKVGRPWTPTARTEHVEIYPTSAFPEVFEEMLMLAHDHDGFTAEDYRQIRDTDFARRLGVTEAG